MTNWHSDTCACIFEVETSRAIRLCRSHNNHAEALATNNAINTRDGINPTRQQIEQQQADRAAEKKKANRQAR